VLKELRDAMPRSLVFLLSQRAGKARRKGLSLKAFTDWCRD